MGVGTWTEGMRNAFESRLTPAVTKGKFPLISVNGDNISGSVGRKCKMFFLAYAR